MKSAKAELTQLQLVRVKRKNIGIEMLKTEETYVRTLDVLVNKIRVSMSTQRLGFLCFCFRFDVVLFFVTFASVFALLLEECQSRT